MELYFIRHGETDWNQARKVQGWSDIPLNEYGRYLAEETAEGMKDVQFDLAFTSPLLRAKETAEIILRGREIPLLETESIKEMCFGKYEGMCISGPNQAPETSEFNKFFKDTEHYIPSEDGESVQELLNRTGKFLEEICGNPEYQEKRILISTHGATMTALLNNIKGNLKIADFWIEKVPANCAVTVAEVKDGKAKITRENLIFYKEEVRQWEVGE